MDKSYRSFVKAITWRITGSIDTFFLTFIVTNKFDFALSISFLEVFTKTLLFWVHERIWDRVRWGRKSWTQYFGFTLYQKIKNGDIKMDVFGYEKKSTENK